MPSPTPKPIIKKAEKLYTNHGMSAPQIAHSCKVSVPTVQRWIKKYQWERTNVVSLIQDIPYELRNPVNSITKHQSVAELDLQHESWLQTLGHKLMDEVDATEPNIARINALKSITDSVTKVIKSLREDVRGIQKSSSDSGINIPNSFLISLVSPDGSIIEIDPNNPMPHLPNQDPYYFDEDAIEVDAEEVEPQEVED